jgi:hypothetical protein
MHNRQDQMRTFSFLVLLLFVTSLGFTIGTREIDRYEAFHTEYKDALRPGRYCPTTDGKTTYSANMTSPVPDRCVGLTFDPGNHYYVVFGTGPSLGPFISVENISVSLGGRNVAVSALTKCDPGEPGRVDCETPVILDGRQLPFKFVQEVLFSADGNHVVYLGSNECRYYCHDRGDIGVCSVTGETHLIVDGTEIATHEGLSNPVFSADGKHFSYTLGEKCGGAKAGMSFDAQKLCERQMNRIDGHDTNWYELVTPVSFSADGKHWAYYARQECFEMLGFRPWTCADADHEVVTDRGTVDLENTLRVTEPNIEFTPDAKFVTLDLNEPGGSNGQLEFLFDFSTVAASFKRHYHGLEIS